MRLLFCFIVWGLSFAYAQELEKLRWYLKPNGQQVSIDTSDLTTEELITNPELDYGYSKLKNYKLTKKVKVAVIDSGIDHKHKEFQENLAYKELECKEGRVTPEAKEDNDGNGFKNDCLGWDFTVKGNKVEDDEGHGTHVSGIIKSFFDFHKEKLEILPIRIFTEAKEDRPLPLKVYDALAYALAEKVDIIHLSMGWPESMMSGKIEKMIQDVLNAGVAIVAAAGNSSQRANIYPCKIKGVICVGALRADGSLASFSNYGPQVDFLAPGEKILSTIPMYLNPQYIPIKGYDYKNGTSQAAPFVTGAYLFLKSFSPQWSAQDIYGRLVSSALPSKVSLRSMFNIPKAISANKGLVIPSFKHLNTVTKGQENTIHIDLFNTDKAVKTKLALKLSCFGEELTSQVELKGKTERKVSFSFTPKSNSSTCELSFEERSFKFNLKALEKPLFTEVTEIEGKGVVRAARNKVLSKLITIPAIPGKAPAAFYYKRVRDKSLHLYKKNQYLGEFKLEKNCERLRLWQADLNKDKDTDFLIEYLCDEKSIKYVFVNQELKEIFPSASFTPSYAIINYADFRLISFEDKRPEFLFITEGFNVENPDPWASESKKSTNLYKLKAQGNEYKELVVNQNKLYKKKLGLRVSPFIRILNILDEERIIISVNKERYFVNLLTHDLEKAPFELVLGGGDRSSKLLNSDEYILNNLLTPYEYNSTLMDGKTLHYSHKDLRDPIMNIYAVEKTGLGYKSYLKTFNHLMILSFDFLGNLTKVSKKLISRFDFLSGEQLEATIHPVMTDEGVKVVVDGTKIHTNYIDILSDESRSIDLGKTCFSQVPVRKDGAAYLPLACFENGKQLLKMIQI